MPQKKKKVNALKEEETSQQNKVLNGFFLKYGTPQKKAELP